MSRITHVGADLLRVGLGRLRDGDRILLRPVGEDRHAELLADDVELVDGRRTLQVAATISGERPAAFSSRPSLPQVVVLPEPCRPHIIRTVTLVFALQVERVIDRAHQVDERLVDDADDLLAGIERLEDRLADRFVGDPLHEVADDARS